MKDVNQEERWMVWMTQAQNFAKRDNFVEAVARARVVVDAVSAAIVSADDPALKKRYEQFRLRAKRLEEKLQSQLDEWNGKIAARREQTMASAADEMARPLPNPPPAARRI